ncbi:glycosyltransferase family 4 protein [Siphonobacter aquaeclarae]|uniref:Glycosyltransferase involved in cell wall bisynthesis n=1 Tax=Siphonobacter aquaeclarae TaxID=563176 RepID=A0A1G9V263_9BACT|nr:glycosyltransferase family 1 protein [Siphonobacter aquaeclarae]SDM66208.1 Glycosyltransferase involved in cell wall bisynthesis [Siphonobacter aquaeclarae]
MNNQNTRILLDCERMKYPHTGLYHFCLQLGKALQKKKRASEIVEYFVPRGLTGVFGDAETRRQNILHKFRLSIPVDIWHSTYQNTHYFPFQSRAKKILTVHDLNFLHEFTSERKKKKYLDSLQKKIDYSDAIVTISNYVRKEMMDYLDLSGRRVDVVYNGCNIQESIIPRKPRFGVDRPFLLSIGTVVPKKNFHVLPAALVNNDYDLLIVGVADNEAYRNKIWEEAKRLGVKDRTRIIGPVTEEEKYWLLQHCELFCFPSLAEGFGLPVIEAMHFGKNVLLSTATSLPEIGGPHAHYFRGFETDEVSDMASLTLEKIQTKDNSREIKSWSEQFSWGKTAEDYLDLYRLLITSRTS